MKWLTKNIWNILIWGVCGLFGVLYFSLIFNRNVTTDEIFTMKLIANDLNGIVKGTANDVHPPLYYFYAKLFECFSPQNIPLQKIAAIIPMMGTIIYVAVVIRKRFGDAQAFFTILFFTCVPCTMEYAVQLRMYSLAILCVTVCGVSSYVAVTDNRIIDWVMVTVSAVGAAYLHYFSFVAVCFEVGLLFLYIIIKNRKLFLRWAISVVAMLILYIPWMPIFYSQVTSTRESYWIAPITWTTVWEYFTWAFDLELVKGFVYVLTVLLVATGVYCLYRLVVKKDNRCKIALLAMLIPTLTSLSGTLISLSKSPIFCGRYVIVAMMLLSIFFGIVFGDYTERLVEEYSLNEKKDWKKVWIPILISVILLFGGAVQYKECFRQEYRSSFLDSTLNFFDKYLGENDYVVYNSEPMRFIYSYYFPEDRLIYVKDFDLSCDYDNVWFLYTLNEWPITDMDCVNYDLRMVYLGLYGVECCNFDLYRITHN